MRVLLADDETDLAAILRRTLREEGCVCDGAGDGESARHQALRGPYYAIVLDLILPHVHGLTILERLRATGRPIPVLTIIARDTTADRVGGLDRGDDDDLTKPFAVDEQVRSLADASHELRTPLATMDAASTWALRRDRSSGAWREGLEIGQRASSRMRGIVEPMLALARAGAGASLPVREEVDLATVAREAAEAIAPLAPTQGARFRIEFPRA